MKPPCLESALNIVVGFLVALSVLLASMMLSPVVSQDSLVWYLAVVAGFAGFLLGAIKKRICSKEKL